METLSEAQMLTNVAAYMDTLRQCILEEGMKAVLKELQDEINLYQREPVEAIRRLLQQHNMNTYLNTQ
ncbi:MAG TPA: hypothetical protein PLE99_05870 [Candidatus Thiothrix moscowensis]|uniref:hypothetical protein n=1 Tax=unclassified Thiothrix TaxID=2636184 RepID=UPI0025E5CA83|nr:MULTISPECIES: hypothetical protein [unclassified Thiothrix]HRJ52272.1 hypothetical protein [Candidatus Thiothrix moscowensis]HRJ92587.1 hypothetical protein [Candidatus Thiothrix moscowensis]